MRATTIALAVVVPGTGAAGRDGHHGMRARS
jgi:hypothetical protein